jgi:hypothetical protein
MKRDERFTVRQISGGGNEEFNMSTGIDNIYS